MSLGGACGPEQSVVDDDSQSPGGKADGIGDVWQMDAETVLEIAHQVSERCQDAPCLDERRVSFEEMQTLFAAVEIETGVPTRLLKAIAFGEAYGVAYSDGWPRHFFDLDVAPNMYWKSRWAWNLLRVELPVVIGDDRSFGSQTYGLGLMQLTAPIEQIKISLAENKKAEAGEIVCGELRYTWQESRDFPELRCRVVVLGGGRPSYWYNHQIDFNTQRAVADPYYNIRIAADLIRFKQNIYGLPERPGGPLPWISLDPESEEDPDMAWALLGSTYQTMGGYGPGGGATERIYNRMTNPEWDAWFFVTSGPQVIENGP